MSSTLTPIADTTTLAGDRLLRVVTTPGTPVGDVFAADGVLDATTPGWRFTVEGVSRLVYQFAEWFHAPAVLEELVRHPTPAGEVIEYTLAWEEDGTPFAAHHVHVLTVDRSSDRILADHFWCGGRWSAAVLAQMEEARDNG